MTKYTKSEFIAIIKTVLICFSSSKTFKSNVDSFLNDNPDTSHCNSFYFALNGSNDIDYGIIECEDALSDIFETRFPLFTNEDIHLMFERYKNII